MNFADVRLHIPSLTDVLRDFDIRLERRMACCPFPEHNDSSPSFSVYPDGQRCGCKGCGFDGDVFAFVQRYLGLADAAEAARWLCDRYGVPPEPPPLPPKRKTKRGPYIEHDDYTDEKHNPLFRVIRYGMIYADTGEPAPGKTFLQGRIVDGRYVSGMDGVRYVLYNLPAVVAATQVYLCEGERDARAVIAAGAVGTTDPGGAGASQHFAERGYPAMLAGKDVIIVPDTDQRGRERGTIIANALHGVASRVRIASLPEPCKDVRDYLEAGCSLADLTLVDFSPGVPEPEPEPPRVTVSDNGGNWKRELLVDKSLNPRPVVANVLTVLRRCPDWQGVLWYNEFSNDAVARKPFPGQENISVEIVWTDRHDTLFVEWLNHNGICVSREVAGQAVQAVAEEQKYHPVREFLQDVGSRWDGDPRIDNWLQEYLHVKCGNFTSAVGARWLISAVARIFEPGCKADCALILEGKQGIKKSTALRALGEPWFTDQIADLGGKEASIQTRGVWIIEIAELDSMRRVEVGRVKAFMSCAADRYRPPYGKRPVDYPRQCVFAGSVNHGTYLHDETGNRRFWPVECHDIDIDGLHAAKEQLWAEAVVRFRDREPWWLDTPQLIQHRIRTGF
jgi:hypothetical protein